ncbi:MAG TPA: DNA-3-methyladenine glycosylase I [Gammaproteobacteria bacterium]|nr:DNA-3-methyladenine glycosylase I [Gammaproteobacteria bacterium]
MPSPDKRRRCPWPGMANDPLYRAYHDSEWGVPVHKEQRWFEFLILEGAQAGLSWATILHKRANYRRAFAGFDPKKVARFGARDVQRLMHDAGIVRNHLKINAAIANACAFLAVQKQFGSFDNYIWRFVNGKPLRNRRRQRGQVPARTRISDAMSRDLKQRGFKFVGSTICYAFMQATGLVDDHLTGCFRHGARR